MESANYTLDDQYNASPATSEINWSIFRQLTIGLLLGMLPFLLMLYFTILTFTTAQTNLALACNVYMGATIYDFGWATLLAFVVSIICLFFRNTRTISLTACAIWFICLGPAFVLFVVLAFGSDGCMRVQ